MAEKDFLEQFSNNGKPDSFKEEERIPVKKEKKPLNTKLLAILAAALVVVGIGIYFIFLAPKIEMLDFVGKDKTDVAAWVKQQGIEASGIIFDEIYDFDTNEGTILSQSIPAGKKVKNNVKLNFVASKGADPDEHITVPDLQNMDKDEIQEWITSNKLTKTRISTSYNDTVPENEVIDFTFTGADEDTFKRSSTLKINISKGPAPAGSVTVGDFEKKPYATVEAWASTNKIKLVKVEEYSEKVDKDYVISQSVASGKTIKEGDTFTVVVSKGTAVYMENIVGWEMDKVKNWCAKNGVSYKEKTLYSDKEKDICIGQSIAKGKLLSEDDYLTVTVSLGNVVTFGKSYIGTEYHEYDGLHAAKDAANELDADITTNKTYEYSDTVGAGKIISYDYEVEIGGVLNIVISKGKNVLLEDIKDKEDSTKTIFSWDTLKYDPNKYTESDVRDACDAEEVTYKIVYQSGSGLPDGTVISAERSDGTTIATGTYCPQDVSITIKVAD